jgi:magnesium chelatase family protein
MSLGRQGAVVLATVHSATLHGLEGRVIRVEVDVAPGLPGFSLVGLADTALLEARERVRVVALSATTNGPVEDVATGCLWRTSSRMAGTGLPRWRRRISSGFRPSGYRIEPD